MFAVTSDSSAGAPAGRDKVVETLKWMARELDDDPRFIRAYESARKPLGLPPIERNAH